MYDLRQMDCELCGITRTQWLDQAERRAQDVLTSHYERILDWADKFANGNGTPDSYVYGLVAKEGTNHACAILEITHARPNSYSPWLKLLSIHFEPNLDIGDADNVEEDIIEDICGILAYIFVESLRLTFKDHPSTTMKIYSRNEFTKGFIQALAAKLRSENALPVMKITSHGRWLVFDMPKE